MTEKQIRKMLLKNLEEKQVKAFEQKKRGVRATERRVVQLINTVDDLKRSKKGRRTAKTSS